MTDPAQELSAFQKTHHLPTLAVCAFSPSGIVPVAGDPHIRFPLASVTKTFTSHLCLQPEPRKYLDTPIQQILPYFKLQDPEASRNMTPRDALCHFSGLPPHTKEWVCCELSREKFIRDCLPTLKLEGPFREKHRYSNILYAVLGQWIEELSGSSWESQVQEILLDPLGMNQTGFLDENWQQDAVLPHSLSPDGEVEQIPPFYARKNHLIAPASEMIGTMTDLAHWGQFMLTLPPEGERWTPHNLVSDLRPFPEFGPLYYGLGWRLDTVNGEPRFWHSGQCSGYSTLLTLYPHRKTGMAAATNRSSAIEALHILDLQQIK